MPKKIEIKTERSKVALTRETSIGDIWTTKRKALQKTNNDERNRIKKRIKRRGRKLL